MRGQITNKLFVAHSFNPAHSGSPYVAKPFAKQSKAWAAL